MDIPNRKKKAYSEKLFNELCLFYLLIASENKADLYVVDKKINKTRRTLYRYIDDLYQNGIIPKASLHKGHNNNYFCMDMNEIQSFYYSDLQKYIEKYILNNKDTYVLSKQHKEKLYRTCLLILNNIDSFYDVEFFDEEQKIYDHPTRKGNSIFAFDSFSIQEGLYENISIKTRQRETNLVKEVIAYMCEE